MLEIRISDPAALSAEETNAVILLLSTLRDAAALPEPAARALTTAGPQEVKAPAPLAVVPSIVGAAGPEIAPAVPTVISPPPTPVVPLPSTPEAATLPALPSTGVDLDSAGLPWDGRIHASTKAKIADGTWRAKRGVDEAVVASVTAELRAAMGAPAAPTPTAAQVFGAPAAPAPIPAPPPPVAAVEPLAPPPPAAPAPSDFGVFCRDASAAMAAGKFSQADVLRAIEGAGLPPSMPALGARADLIPSVRFALGM